MPVPDRCTNDAECAGLRLGFCHSLPPQKPSCESGCTQDSDCPSGICVCDGSASAGKCAPLSTSPSACRVDRDCSAGSLCALAPHVCGDSTFECTTAADECHADTDCTAQGRCSFETDHLACVFSVCGRPFLVNETARLAAVSQRRDWLTAEPKPDLTALTALERAERAGHWARLGQMEHASIAAFARFNLQLLSLGAPADLIEACNRALVDETRHTRVCFAFASHYAGTALGPSKLEVRDGFEDMSLVAVMKLVLREGCLGETVAALEALEDAEKATDPVVRGALQGIARDEQSHAELAFHFMSWALTQSSNELRAEMARESELRIAAFERAASDVQLVAARAVVRPLVEALFAGPTGDALNGRRTVSSPT